MSLQSRSAEIDLRRWLNAGEDSDVQILTITFLVGSEELALVDNSGTARIFSLVTEQFRCDSRVLGGQKLALTMYFSNMQASLTETTLHP